MRIPKSLKIGGHTYSVSIVKPSEVSDDKSACGATTYSRGVIELNANRMKSHIEQTLFHEVFHVLNSELHHALLDSLAQQIYQVLSDNKMLK